MNVISSNDEFDKLIKYEKKIFFKFTASWCNPCKQIKPHLEKMANKHIICTVDIDEHPDIADKYNINSIPTILYFKNGVCQDQVCKGSSIENLYNFFSQYN